jgi:hypothetical protein
MRVIGSVVIAMVVAFSGCGGCGADLSGPAKEIVSEDIQRDGDVWRVSFVSTFAAPVDKVYDAYTRPERGHELDPERILKAEVVSEEGNKKVVDIVGRLDILPPGFKVQNLRNEYTFFPDEKRITSRTIDFNLADIESEYRFEATPDGNTVLRFSQTSKDKAPLIVESLQKGALRETYITQVQLVNKALGIESEDAPDTQG